MVKKQIDNSEKIYKLVAAAAVSDTSSTSSNIPVVTNEVKLLNIGIVLMRRLLAE